MKLSGRLGALAERNYRLFFASSCTLGCTLPTR